MKKILYVFTALLGVAVLVFAFTCVKFVETGSEHGRWFFVKNGRWGVVFKEDALAVLPFGRIGYGYLKIPEERIGKSFSEGFSGSRGIECRYDALELAQVGSANMFVGSLDGKKYYFDECGEQYAAGKPVQRVEMKGGSTSNCMNDPYFYRFYTSDGVYYENMGPYQDILLGFFGYAIKKNNGWGFVYGRHDISRGKGKSRFEQIVPCAYDEIIEAISGVNLKYNRVLARKGKVWTVYDRDGNVVQMNRAIIDKAKKIKDEKTQEALFTYGYK